MTAYEDIKLLLMYILGYKKDYIKNNMDRDISPQFQQSRHSATQDDPSKIPVIKGVELKELYEKVDKMNIENAVLYDSESYEVAVNIGRAHGTGKGIKDKNNSISYTVGEPSCEYCMFLLMQLSKMDDNGSRQFNLRQKLLSKLRQCSKGGTFASGADFLKELFSKR